jgi:hypothetical protein
VPPSPKWRDSPQPDSTCLQAHGLAQYYHRPANLSIPPLNLLSASPLANLGSLWYNPHAAGGRKAPAVAFGQLGVDRRAACVGKVLICSSYMRMNPQDVNGDEPRTIGLLVSLSHHCYQLSGGRAGRRPGRWCCGGSASFPVGADFTSGPFPNDATSPGNCCCPIGTVADGHRRVSHRSGGKQGGPGSGDGGQYPAASKELLWHELST